MARASSTFLSEDEAYAAVLVAALGGDTGNDCDADGACLDDRIVKALSPDARRTAFVTACELILAEGLSRTAESRAIISLVRHLRVDTAFAKSVVATLRARQSDSFGWSTTPSLVRV